MQALRAQSKLLTIISLPSSQAAQSSLLADAVHRRPPVSSLRMLQKWLSCSAHHTACTKLLLSARPAVSCISLVMLPATVQLT